MKIMKVMTNSKIRSLFIGMSAIIMIFGILSVACLISGMQKAALCILLCFFGMGIGVFLLCFRYFIEENRVMEDAVTQVREYISGDQNARIDCNEEGELYRLFHEVNSLAAILNAQAENKEKSRVFLANIISDISHQLKTPLAALNIYNGIMQAEAETKDMPTVREFSSLSEQELDRIETLIQNLLKISKFDAGAIVIERNPEDISEMMEDVKKQFSYRACQEEKSIILSGDTPLTFSCDRSWLLEAVGNIVKNALDHTENGDSVWIEWSQSASSVRIVIRDNGCGIHPEDLYYIFKRFYRSRYSKDKQGIGLGLPLAKSVIEAHGGTVEVESRLGAGASFIINFFNPTKL